MLCPTYKRSFCLPKRYVEFGMSMPGSKIETLMVGTETSGPSDSFGGAQHAVPLHVPALGQRVDLGVQSALVTGGFVFTDDALIDHLINDRDSSVIGLLGNFFVTFRYGNNNFLELAT